MVQLKALLQYNCIFRNFKSEQTHRVKWRLQSMVTCKQLPIFFFFSLYTLIKFYEYHSFFCRLFQSVSQNSNTANQKIKLPNVCLRRITMSSNLQPLQPLQILPSTLSLSLVLPLNEISFFLSCFPAALNLLWPTAFFHTLFISFFLEHHRSEHELTAGECSSIILVKVNSGKIH